MRQSNTRAARRSWYNHRFGAMTMSPLTVVKGAYHPGLAPDGIIRWLPVHDRMSQIELIPLRDMSSSAPSIFD
jgi:hypothetical protein